MLKLSMQRSWNCQQQVVGRQETENKREKARRSVSLITLETPRGCRWLKLSQVQDQWWDNAMHTKAYEECLNVCACATRAHTQTQRKAEKRPTCRKIWQNVPFFYFIILSHWILPFDIILILELSSLNSILSLRESIPTIIWRLHIKD